ncbi:hypothetical protein LOK49_LG12G00880 [Camellia lanceoleosa]|uniref:Uncharacterized protein n=1 Tax=Camellia lanceoleosa TaxID=1840588 RepID=A0ACC0FSC5_9ERIC|nr:hypothetical protein LOK49_LG12G00880 [Camellia lanceoleosa]
MEIKIRSPINQYTVNRAGAASNLMGSVNAPEDSEDEVPPNDAPEDAPANVMPLSEQPQYLTELLAMEEQRYNQRVQWEHQMANQPHSFPSRLFQLSQKKREELKEYSFITFCVLFNARASTSSINQEVSSSTRITDLQEGWIRMIISIIELLEADNFDLHCFQSLTGLQFCLRVNISSALALLSFCFSSTGASGLQFWSRCSA